MAEKAEIIEEKVVSEGDETSSDETVETKDDKKSSSSEKKLKKQLQAAEKKVDDEHDRLLRLSAEFENYKKRSAREISDYKKFANESLIKQLLPVIDNIERAISSSAEGENINDSLIQGVEMTHKELLKLIEQFSATALDVMHKPFDPNFHLAVTQEETDEHPKNTVITELQKGYLLHNRLIRPAMVVVSKEPSEKKEDDKEV